jgi:tetratricopeptide (TPR) repeat protein
MKILLYPLILLSFLFRSHTAFSQQRNSDSLFALLAKDKLDTLKLQHLNALAYEFIKARAYDTAFYYLNLAIHSGDTLLKQNEGKATQIVKTIKRGISGALHYSGLCYYFEGKYPEALEKYGLSLKINKEITNKKGAAFNQLNTGAIYYFFGDYDKALENFIATKKLFEEISEKKGQADADGNIGAIYLAQRVFPKAISHFSEALKLYIEIENKPGIATCYMNMGAVYASLKDFKKALENQLAALKIKKEIDFKQGIAESYANIGHIYWQQKDYQRALENYFLSFHLYEELNDKQGCTFINIYLGGIYTDLKDYSNAIKYLNQGLAQANELGIKSMKQEAFYTLARTYAAQGNFKLAFENQKEYGSIHDSLFGEENNKKIAELEARYQNDKKEQELKLIKAEQEKEREVAQQKNKFQQIVIGSVVLILLLVIIFTYFVLRSLNITRNQKNIIEQKQIEILDSIHYAKKIQTALMTNEKYFENTLNKLNK